MSVLGSFAHGIPACAFSDSGSRDGILQGVAFLALFNSSGCASAKAPGHQGQQMCTLTTVRVSVSVPFSGVGSWSPG